MLSFSGDPQVAERQMRAIIFYLTTFGYIDGDFDSRERSFVRDYIERLVSHRVETGASQLPSEGRLELTRKYTAHFHEVFEGVDEQVRELFSEAVARDEDQDAFVHARLKLRCFEIIQDFDPQGQQQLLSTIDHLIMADGEAHPAELKFRDELRAALGARVEMDESSALKRCGVNVQAPVARASGHRNHPFFEQFEHHYSADPAVMERQLSADRELIARTVARLSERRARGAGALLGKADVEQLRGQPELLDGHIQALVPAPDKRYELTVLGDLHGCYSCLKGALIQARFFEKVAAFRADPSAHPEPKLVLLGDYIDRGIFSLNGVLRSVLEIYCTAPEHVVVLRGNHEYFIEYNGAVYGGVKPSEAIDTLKPHVSTEVFLDYMRLFDHLPSAFIFDRTFFVHGGIPRDRSLRERYRDLSSLNDGDLRFQMMWSDPSSADVIPADLQDQSARFAFGRLQAQQFLHKLGCHTLIRGHEKINSGFARNYDDASLLLITLFSSGGLDNDDLPERSSYREVTPMALTLRWEAGETEITPWEIDYKPYNDPQRNRFFERPPELPFPR